VKAVSLLMLLAVATPAFAVISEPSAPPVEPVQDAKKAMPQPFLHYDSRRTMMKPMQLDDRVRAQRLGPNTADPKDKAGPEIR
jgi:hypothetical protein